MTYLIKTVEAGNRHEYEVTAFNLVMALHILKEEYDVSSNEVSFVERLNK